MKAICCPLFLGAIWPHLVCIACIDNSRRFVSIQSYSTKLYDLTSISISDGRLPPGSKNFVDVPTQILKLKLNLPKELTETPRIESLSDGAKHF